LGIGTHLDEGKGGLAQSLQDVGLGAHFRGQGFKALTQKALLQSEQLLLHRLQQFRPLGSVSSGGFGGGFFGSL
jgi:hypothetical protein